MNKQGNELKGHVFSTLDAIESACKTTAKAWDKKSKGIPVALYIQVVKNAKWESNTNNQIALDYIDSFNQMLTSLTDAGIESAKSFNSDYIPLTYINESINLLKKSFEEGAGKNV